jgi:hypothetical protein
MLPLVRVVAGSMSDIEQKIKTFCLIQLQLLNEKEKELRKQILDCNIQREFITSVLSEIEGDDD